MRVQLIRLFIIVCCVVAIRQTSAVAANGPVLLSKRTASQVLADVRATNVGDCSSHDRIDGLVALLRQEMKDPSLPVFGSGGGPIDSGYLQEVIMGSVCTFAQQGQVRNEIRSFVLSKLQWVAPLDRPMADRLTIILGYAGERSVVPALVAILGIHPDGYMRHSAALALGVVRDRSSIPALRLALETDTYARVRLGACFEKPLTRKEAVYSPVRRAAAEALKSMGETVSEEDQYVAADGVMPALEQVLISAPYTDYQTLQLIGDLACEQGEAVLQRYIDARQKDPAGPGGAGFAKCMLERSKLIRAAVEAAAK